MGVGDTIWTFYSLEMDGFVFVVLRQGSENVLCGPDGEPIMYGSIEQWKDRLKDLERQGYIIASEHAQLLESLNGFGLFDTEIELDGALVEFRKSQ